jgi:hypothetical protein
LLFVTLITFLQCRFLVRALFLPYCLVTFCLFVSTKVSSPNLCSSLSRVTFFLAQKRGIKREFDEPALCVSKKGHLRQIEDSTKSMLLPAVLTPTSLAQDPCAPALPFTIGVGLALFVPIRLVLRTLPVIENSKVLLFDN